MIKYYCDKCERQLTNENVVAAQVKTGKQSYVRHLCPEHAKEMLRILGIGIIEKSEVKEEPVPTPVKKQSNSESAPKIPERLGKPKLTDDEISEVLDELSGITKKEYSASVKQPVKIVEETNADDVSACNDSPFKEGSQLQKLYLSLSPTMRVKPTTRLNLVELRRALLMLYTGIPQSEIARLLGCDYQKIFQWKKKFACQECMQRLYSETGKSELHRKVVNSYKASGDIYSITSTCSVSLDNVVCIIEKYTGIPFN